MKRGIVLFVLNFLKKPLQNASIVPSSRAAAKVMIADVDFSRVHTVLELGPGTGVFTQEIIRRARADTTIVLIEIEESYVHALRKRFGWRLAVEHTSAHFLDSVLKKHNIDKVDLIVSGLPFFPGAVEGGLLQALRHHTDRGTIFRFFTYMPPVMKRVYKDLLVRKIAFVARNIPPLWVYGIN